MNTKGNFINHTKVILVIILLFILNISFLAFSLKAQATRSGTSDSDTQLNIDDSIDIKPITIPVFRGLGVPGKYATVLSWLSFIGTIFSVGIIAFWVFLLVRAAFLAAKSEGDEGGLGDAQKRVKSTFIGAAMSIIIPGIISLIGVGLGLGPLWTWPVAFNSCDGGSDGESQYLFQEFLKTTDKEQAYKNCGIDY
jgi:hypothetical protein